MIIKVNHTVGGESTSHYIEELTISYNGQKVIIQKMTRQLHDSQTFLYFMPAVREGDEIEIIAVCNIFGQRSVKFTVEDKE